MEGQKKKERERNSLKKWVKSVRCIQFNPLSLFFFSIYFSFLCFFFHRKTQKEIERKRKKWREKGRNRGKERKEWKKKRGLLLPIITSSEASSSKRKEKRWREKVFLFTLHLSPFTYITWEETTSFLLPTISALLPFSSIPSLLFQSLFSFLYPSFEEQLFHPI